LFHAERPANWRPDPRFQGADVQRQIAASRGAKRRDPRIWRGSEYDAFYRTLDLPPGASLRQVEDSARLLRAAFQPEGVSGRLRRPTEDRAAAIDRAAAELCYFWWTYERAPPSADLSQAGGLLDALVDALGESAIAAAEPAATQPVRDAPGTSAIPPREAADHVEATTHEDLLPAPTTSGFPQRRPLPAPRLHRIELAVMLHDEIFAALMQPAANRVPASFMPVASPVTSSPAVVKRSAPIQIAGARQYIALASPAPPAGTALAVRARSHVGKPGLRWIAMKAGAVGLAIAFGMLLHQYAFG
jgi:hypothetical protein